MPLSSTVPTSKRGGSLSQSSQSSCHNEGTIIHTTNNKNQYQHPTSSSASCSLSTSNTTTTTTKKQLKLRRIIMNETRNRTPMDQCAVLESQQVLDDLVRPMDMRQVKPQQYHTNNNFAHFPPTNNDSCITTTTTDTATTSGKVPKSKCKTPPRNIFDSVAKGMSSTKTMVLQPPIKDSRRKQRTFPSQNHKQSNQDPPASSPPSGTPKNPIMVDNCYLSNKTVDNHVDQSKIPDFVSENGKRNTDTEIMHHASSTMLLPMDSLNNPNTDRASGVMMMVASSNSSTGSDFDDDSTAVADHRTCTNTSNTSILQGSVQHLSPISSSIGMEHSPKAQQEQQHRLSYSIGQPQQIQSQRPFNLSPTYNSEYSPCRTTPSRKQYNDTKNQETITTPVRSPQSKSLQHASTTTPTSRNSSSSNTSHTVKNQNRVNRHKPPSPLLKAALARPFGRISTKLHSWVVEVSSAEWDGDVQRWKYRILVQKRPEPTTTATTEHGTETSVTERNNMIGTATSFTSVFTWRSVEDFFWLEQSLQKEFQGALLVPLLSVALGRTSSVAAEMPVESDKLKHWLSDILNGIRGSGEWNLPIQQQQPTSPNSKDKIHLSSLYLDVMQCSSLETFLYRNLDGCTLVDTNEYELHHLATTNDTDATSPSSFQCGNVSDHYLHCSDVALKLRSQQRHRTRHRNKNNDDYQDEDDDDDDEEEDEEATGQASILQTLIDTIAVPIEMCAGQSQRLQPSPLNCGLNDTSSSNKSQRKGKTKIPLGVTNYSSRALGTASDLNIIDSFFDNTDTSVSVIGSQRMSNDIAIHTELLQAEKALAQNYRKTALAALEKLHALHDEEEKLGVAWNRFAVALSNLFAHEKSVETASLGDLKLKRDQMPYRKIDKKAVDDCLRDMARQKVERSTPALVALSTMMHAYVADLSSVDPAVDYFTKAVSKYVNSLDDISPSKQGNSIADTSSESSVDSESPQHRMLQPTLKALKSFTELKDWTIQSLNRATTVSGQVQQQEQSVHDLNEQRESGQRKQEAIRKELLANENLLRFSLTTMFRTTPFRISRMAWRYWNTEASQCALLNSAAAALRAEVVDVVSKSAITKMLKLHTKDEMSDSSIEFDLIQRIVNLDKWKKYSIPGDMSQRGGSASIESTKDNSIVEVDTEEINEARSKAILRDEALDIARQRIGRWDAAVATAIMKAVGVNDPNVRVEETTKDLRLVRKYAISLREHVDHCMEAVHFLHRVVTTPTKMNGTTAQSQMTQGSPDFTLSQIRARRNEFFDEICVLFSGSFAGEKEKNKSSSVSLAILKNAGINTSDPYGWIPAASDATTNHRRSTILSQNRVGDLAYRYINVRDSQVIWLLGSLEGLLKEYYQRVEAIESFVYMECLGIQLEKHFSTKRAKALSSFEKKTDLTAAINMASRKRMKNLLVELQSKMDKLGPDISHTTVKETKEAHLESKKLKDDLHELAVRRLIRARESSTERAITIMSLWAKEEEVQATEELKAVGEAMATLERLVCTEDFET